MCHNSNVDMVWSHQHPQRTRSHVRLCEVDVRETHGLDWMGVAERICTCVVNLGFRAMQSSTIVEPVAVRGNLSRFKL